jgi:uncharacterized protein (DUF1778 family)
MNTDKHKMIQIRTSESEFSAFNSAANEAGLTLSAWMRTRCREAAEDELREAGKPVAFKEKPPKCN